MSEDTLLDETQISCSRVSKIRVHVEICRKTATLPTYANTGDAGMDVYAAEQVVIKPNETVAIPTGLKLAIPAGYEIQVRPRSGISFKTPLRISNSPGTIDSGYRDELFIIMTNTSHKCVSDTYDDVLHVNHGGNGVYCIEVGDRIAQIFINPVPRIQFEVVDSVLSIGNNRGGGLGSTGVK